MNTIKAKQAITWMLAKDFQAVVEIEHCCFGPVKGYNEKDIKHMLRAENCVGLVIRNGPTHLDEITGHIIYRIHRQLFSIEALAIHPNYQRNGYGSALVTRLYDKLEASRKNCIEIVVRETLLPAQKFLKKIGFRAIHIAKEYFEDTYDNKKITEDGYLFTFKLKE